MTPPPRRAKRQAGRPRTEDAGRLPMVSVSVLHRQADWLHAQRDLTGVSIARLVRDALELLIAERVARERVK